METMPPSEEVVIVLPSDPTWQLDMYFKMIEAQKHQLRHQIPAPWAGESEAKRARVSTPSDRVKTAVPHCRRSILSAGGLAWSSADIALAASLLETPEARYPSVTFLNQEEKRRVFTLVYDVLRYKSVLNQALNDVHFFIRHSHLKNRCHMVWLMFFDLYKRDFSPRDTLTCEVEKAFAKHGLHEIDALLWDLRVRLAATVSRLRIQSGAHSLGQLLPSHLRLLRPTADEHTVTGWVNAFITSMEEVTCQLDEMGIKPLGRERDCLEPLTFKTDHLLPRFLHVRPEAREDLVDSPLVKEYKLILQERTFCLGPAIFAQLLRNLDLSGKVAQTHVNSPTTTAYLANLLVNNSKIEALLVFGTGSRKTAYEEYLEEVGVKNTQVYTERFADLVADSRVLDNVVAVLATAPNSNSAVRDPVDLAVTRGGDLEVLQQLTADDFASTPKGEHIKGLLSEQKSTLRRAMSKPQIQFVLYETHSRFVCENEEMALSLVSELNNYATEVHLEELRKSQGESQEKEGDPQELPTVRLDDESVLSLPIPTVVVPPSDLFELAELPDLCPNLDNCLQLMREGTYLAYIKRKEIIRLDAKYMIQMAEARGLFGRPEGTPKDKKSGQTARAKAALAALQARSEMLADKSKTKVKVEVDRIAAPTRASILRDVKSPEEKDCPRFSHHLAHDGTPLFLKGVREQRKTFLTKEEEEQLIQRLYACPRVHLFPPTLYEDLPPLEFWNSPASVIQSYLQSKIFQKRLQAAYEYNQKKETKPDSQKLSEQAPDDLSRAVLQLTTDRKYFETLYSKMTLSEVTDENKALWDRIKNTYEKKFIQDLSDVEKTKRDTDRTTLKQYIFNHKDFYRLKNLRTVDEIPLATTIDMPPCIESFESTDYQFKTEPECKDKNQRVIENEENDSVKIVGPKKQGFSLLPTISFDIINKDHSNMEKVRQRKFLVAVRSEDNFELSTSQDDSPVRLPKRRYSSLDSLRESIMFQYTSDDSFDSYENSLPGISQTSSKQEILLRNFGTQVTIRDSVELAQNRLSKLNKIILPKKIKSDVTSVPLTYHKNSLTMTSKRLEKYKTKNSISSNPSNKSKSNYEDFSDLLYEFNQNTIRDSVLVNLKRMSNRDKICSKTSICDICNKNFKSIHFLCPFHSKLVLHLSPEKREANNLKNSILAHRDSIDIIKKKKLLKRDYKTSTGSQTLDISNVTQELTSTPNIENSYKKEDSAGKNNLLNDYLLQSVQITSF